jgi:hypothetical protein
MCPLKCAEKTASQKTVVEAVTEKLGNPTEEHACLKDLQNVSRIK